MINLKSTKVTTNELKEAGIKFLKTFGAGIIAFLIMIVMGLPASAEQVLALAVLAAVNKYLMDKGIYSVAFSTATKVVKLKK